MFEKTSKSCLNWQNNTISIAFRSLILLVLAGTIGARFQDTDLGRIEEQKKEKEQLTMFSIWKVSYSYDSILDYSTEVILEEPRPTTLRKPLYPRFLFFYSILLELELLSLFRNFHHIPDFDRSYSLLPQSITLTI